MKKIDDRHIHVLDFPKQLLWTDRDLEYFLEEMPSEERRMNNDLYDLYIKEVVDGQGFLPDEAFNLAYYECVRISLAKYPESRDISDVLEMDIQHNQSDVNYAYTDLIMNMVWAMLHSTNTAQRFTDKLHSYLVRTEKLCYYFKNFFTPNDYVHSFFPYEEEPEPRYNIKFIPCPSDLEFNKSNGEWDRLTAGYQEHLIGELLQLWPEDKREYIRKCIMDEKNANNQSDNTALLFKALYKAGHPDKLVYKFGHPTRAKSEELAETKQLLQQQKEEVERWKKRCEELESGGEAEQAFNAQTGKPCFTSKQMCILLRAIAELTEQPNPPAKTTLGCVVERIAGYAGTTATANLKATPTEKDKEFVASALEDKFPKLAAQIRRL